ncbi:hypothetical protein KUTeg_004736 [Tegillarca granosa]|uniref:Uncharacterized protein n=1 Tax=Tegillarca granosa TaxID=220873 RepID=A0ABQ9FJV3_TEGGR|nr:hypothetical protein KUTeg_004736 [Tegillarca granosa]
MTDFDSEDDLRHLECGDLGLGEGLKPGSLLGSRYRSQMSSNENSDKSELLKPSEEEADITEVDRDVENGHEGDHSDHHATQPHHHAQSSLRKLIELKAASRHKHHDKQVKEKFPTYADVPYGTSLKQQKRLFDKSIEDIKRRQRCYSLDSGELGQSKKDEYTQLKMTKADIDMKLSAAEQEVEELKLELETYERRLDAKYKAIAILRKQAADAEAEHSELEKRARHCNTTLAEELNKLHFELNWRESSIEDSQERWTERFDSISKENASLMIVLEERSEELGHANARILALDRERDELLALLDVHERSRYMKSRSRTSDDGYFDYTSTELAVLGACKCRIKNPEPCGCAHAAANMRREMIKMKHESYVGEPCCDLYMELQKRRQEEAYLTADVYKSAFEDQLQRNKLLMLNLANIATPRTSKLVKAKAAVKTLIQILNDESVDLPVVKPMNDRELVLALTEILHERNEAFFHQKLASQVLAEKVKHLEEKLENQDQEVFTPD